MSNPLLIVRYTNDYNQAFFFKDNAKADNDYEMYLNSKHYFVKTLFLDQPILSSIEQQDELSYSNAMVEKIEEDTVFEIKMPLNSYNENIVNKKIESVLSALTINDVLEKSNENFKKRADVFEVIVRNVTEEDNIIVKIKAIFYVLVNEETLEPLTKYTDLEEENN